MLWCCFSFHNTAQFLFLRQHDECRLYLCLNFVILIRSFDSINCLTSICVQVTHNSFENYWRFPKHVSYFHAFIISIAWSHTYDLNSKLVFTRFHTVLYLFLSLFLTLSLSPYLFPFSSTSTCPFVSCASRNTTIHMHAKSISVLERFFSLCAMYFCCCWVSFLMFVWSLFLLNKPSSLLSSLMSCCLALVKLIIKCIRYSEQFNVYHSLTAWQYKRHLYNWDIKWHLISFCCVQHSVNARRVPGCILFFTFYSKHWKSYDVIFNLFWTKWIDRLPKDDFPSKCGQYGCHFFFNYGPEKSLMCMLIRMF